MNSKAKGEISEAMVIAKLLKAGKVVLQPFGDNQRYDLVIDEGDLMVKAQVKTGRRVGDSIEFNVSSVNGFTGERTTYEGQVDVFLVYFPEDDSVYQVPVSECGSSAFRLRLTEPSKFRPNARMAADYLI